MLLFQQMRKPDFNIFAHLWNEEVAKDDNKRSKSTDSATAERLVYRKSPNQLKNFYEDSLKRAQKEGVQTAYKQEIDCLFEFLRLPVPLEAPPSSSISAERVMSYTPENPPNFNQMVAVIPPQVAASSLQTASRDISTSIENSSRPLDRSYSIFSFAAARVTWSSIRKQFEGKI